jgi:hypothetical protein
MKAFISNPGNIYYEAIDRINPSDIEVPARPTVDHVFINGQWVDKSYLAALQAQQVQAPPTPQYQIPPQPPVVQHAPQSNLNDLIGVVKQLQSVNGAAEKEKDKGFLGDKFTWKDLITILYFAGGIVGLWMHMNERIIILEQKVVSIEKGSAELQASFKEFTFENKNQLKNIDSKITDLQQMVISRISSGKKE